MTFKRPTDTEDQLWGTIVGAVIENIWFGSLVGLIFVIWLLMI